MSSKRLRRQAIQHRTLTEWIIYASDRNKLLVVVLLYTKHYCSPNFHEHRCNKWALFDEENSLAEGLTPETHLYWQCSLESSNILFPN